MRTEFRKKQLAISQRSILSFIACLLYLESTKSTQDKGNGNMSEGFWNTKCWMCAGNLAGSGRWRFGGPDDGFWLNGCVQMAENCQQLWIDGENASDYLHVCSITSYILMLGILPANIAGIHWEMRKSTPKINIQIHWHWFAHFVFASHPPLLATYNNLPWFAVFTHQDTDDEGRFSGRPGGWWIFRWFGRRCTKEPVPLDAGQWCHSNVSFRDVVDGDTHFLMLQKSIEIPKPTT